MTGDKHCEENGASNDSMERYVAGELSGAERERFEAEILGDEAQSEELYQDVNMHAALTSLSPQASRSADARAGNRRPGSDLRPLLRRKHRWTLSAAAAIAAVLLFALWTSRPGIENQPGPGSTSTVTEDGPRFRGKSAPTSFGSFAPRGMLTEPPSALSWTPDAGASRYRVRIERRDGSLLFEEEIAARFDADGSAGGIVRYALVSNGIDWAENPAVQWNVTALDEDGAVIAISPWNPILVDSR